MLLGEMEYWQTDIFGILIKYHFWNSMKYWDNRSKLNILLDKQLILTIRVVDSMNQKLYYINIR